MEEITTCTEELENVITVAEIKERLLKALEEGRFPARVRKRRVAAYSGSHGTMCPVGVFLPLELLKKLKTYRFGSRGINQLDVRSFASPDHFRLGLTSLMGKGYFSYSLSPIEVSIMDDLIQGWKQGLPFPLTADGKGLSLADTRAFWQGVQNAYDYRIDEKLRNTDDEILQAVFTRIDQMSELYFLQ